MKSIRGVSHPIPTKYAKRIYEGKTVFVGKSHLGKVSKGDKFVIYESQGAKAYTGWADIKNIHKVRSDEIINMYKDKLMLTSEEFRDYSKKKFEMNIIEFENFESFKNIVVPKRFVSMLGKYIYEDEFRMIEKNKG